MSDCEFENTSKSNQINIRLIIGRWQITTTDTDFKSNNSLRTLCYVESALKCEFFVTWLRYWFSGYWHD